MILPGAAKKSLRAEQALRDFTIAMTRQPCIEGPHNQYGAPATLVCERKRRRTRTPTFDGGPESMCRLQTYVEIGVEWQFDGKQQTTDRHCRQVEPVDCTCHRHDGMPSIQSLTKVAGRERGQVKATLPDITGRDGFPQRQDSR